MDRPHGAAATCGVKRETCPLIHLQNSTARRALFVFGLGLLFLATAAPSQAQGFRRFYYYYPTPPTYYVQPTAPVYYTQPAVAAEVQPEAPVAATPPAAAATPSPVSDATAPADSKTKTTKQGDNAKKAKVDDKTVAAKKAEEAAKAAAEQPSTDPYGFTAWLNQTRAAYGLGAVGYDPNLSAWAAVNNQHQNSRGIGHYVMGSARRQNSAMGGYESIGAMWLASPAHRAALLDPSITAIGIAGLGAYWTFNAY